mmetsp:Transcript_2421/g.3424  ORF Transcript_2421/g.3424 Transcript_2421/m.3424 type:complete len:329 (+) Transcript_2421:283-1269(+)
MKITSAPEEEIALVATKRKRSDFSNNMRKLGAGGLAGIAAKAVVAPVERLKIIYQVTNEKFSLRKMGNSFQVVIEKEGITGLWRGYSATMLKVFPYAGIQFSTFDGMKKYLLSQKDGDCTSKELTNLEALICGSTAGVMSIVFTYPLDLLRTMLAVEREKRQYSPHASLIRTFRAFMAEEGIKGLYRGVTPTILGILPYGGIAFMVNEHFKNKMERAYEVPPVHLKLLSGGLAGLLAQSVSYPFEVIRRRMQTDGVILRDAGLGGVLDGKLPEQAEARMTMLQTAQKLVDEQGIRGLFKGLSINWIRAPIAISISFTAFDGFKKILDV